MPTRTVVTINSSGRQAASFIRCASAVGWKVRAQMRDRIGIVAQDICSLPNVEVVEGSLSDPRVIEALFEDSPQLAFINTTHWGNEVEVGKSIADAAKAAGVQHLIFSSMPDHSKFGKGWRNLPMWSDKYQIEQYIKELGIPATFIYCGIYHNNFTSLPYPLFRMELLEDDSFEWQAPFHPHQKLPWLDAEHDVGPVVLALFIEGPTRWSGKRLPIAFQYLTPLEVCEAFSIGLDRPVHYVRGPIAIDISIPNGYREHLEILQQTLGRQQAPYFGPDLEDGSDDCTAVSLQLWEGNRDLEEYAREVFPLEERANGLTWMEEGDTEDDPYAGNYITAKGLSKVQNGVFAPQRV